MIHGHEVLHMMEGNNYSNRESLVEAIINKFGPDERFYTCSAEGMTAEELVDFLEARGKFMPSNNDDFTVDTSKICITKVITMIKNIWNEYLSRLYSYN